MASLATTIATSSVRVPPARGLVGLNLGIRIEQVISISGIDVVVEDHDTPGGVGFPVRSLDPLSGL
jgi:hypothetical protein